MGEKIIAFATGVVKAYDLFGSFDKDEKKHITIQSGFENVGEAFKKVISEDVKQNTKKQNKQTACA